MLLDDANSFNARLEKQFEEKFSKIFNNSTEQEKYFLTIHKYCLRKKFISSFRIKKDLNILKSILYSGFLKFDSYFLLTFKIFLNIVIYFFILPLFSYKKLSFKGKTFLRQAYPSNKNEHLEDCIYYPGTIQHYFKYRKKIQNFFNKKHILIGLRNTNLPSIKFIKDVSQSFSSGKFNPLFVVSIILFHSLYSVCRSMITKDHDIFLGHYTYGAVVAPQKIFSIHFIESNKESHIISHGSFHCIQCTFQPATKFISLTENADNMNMSSSEYFSNNILLNPFKSIDFSVRESCDFTLDNYLSKVKMKEMQKSRILIFSSAFDAGIGRDPFFGIFNILLTINKYKTKDIYVKLHPSESKFFFNLLYFLLFRKKPYVIEKDIENYSFDIAIGLPSTLINELNKIKNIFVYSPIEYVGYDVVHRDNVKYFGKSI